MSIFKKDLKNNLKSSFIWIIAASFMGFLQVSVYESMILTSTEQWNKMMASMPKAMVDAFQITNSTFDNILNYYAMEGYLYVALLLSVFAAMLGAKLINKEESDKTTEFLLSKPISRKRYITEKLLTLFIFIFFANIITSSIIYAGMLIGSPNSFSLSKYILYSLGIFSISLSFGLISFSIGSVLKRVKGLSGMALGIVFLSFFLGILSNISNTFTNLKYLSLFKYMDANRLLEKGLEMPSIIIFSLIMICSIIISYTIFTKKDLYN